MIENAFYAGLRLGIDGRVAVRQESRQFQPGVVREVFDGRVEHPLLQGKIAQQLHQFGVPGGGVDERLPLMARDSRNW